MEALSQWEGQFLLFLQDNARGALDGPLSFITRLGDHGLFWIAVTLILLIPPRTRRIGLASVFALLLSLLISNIILKNLVARVRPYDYLAGLTPLTGPEHDWSFPSGHASASFASAWAMLRMKLRPRWPWVCAVVLAAMIALTRLYVGVHYPTDVLAGTCIGLLAGEIGARCATKVRAPGALLP